MLTVSEDKQLPRSLRAGYLKVANAVCAEDKTHGCAGKALRVWVDKVARVRLKRIFPLHSYHQCIAINAVHVCVFV